MRDKVLVATTSVLIIAFSISLLNIYVLPEIRFQLDVSRGYANDSQYKMLLDMENIAISSSYFEDINFSRIIYNIPEHSIVNITYMLEQVEKHESAAYDTLKGIYFNTNEDIPQPKQIKMTYNGSISFVVNNSTNYTKKILSFYKEGGNNATYFVVLNSSSYLTKCNISEVGISQFEIYEPILRLEELFNDVNTKPFYVIYQHVYYEETRGLLLSYSTSFTRMIFLNIFGDLLFFITNEGYWIKPLDLLI
ncbi:MAG: hypothetical protein K9W46_01810 [Candidatus Heimdallarchaeum endolithica]|uniref:Uncharacterized protein n=1 Tax=Candidatus Heimdallarchaeum endolithica TaxID=2876572 RepID=A0A9Y1FNN5_9ARCH|nr:MAG: hypothetical protein K9W46_01810 [Candidatus Heimdallarchaeum endolithica]